MTCAYILECSLSSIPSQIFYSPASMNMTKDMKTRPNSPQRLKEGVASVSIEIEVSIWRSVGDEDISQWRNGCPGCSRLAVGLWFRKRAKTRVLEHP